MLRRHARVIAATGNPDAPLTAADAFRPPPGMTPAQGLGLLAAMLLVLLSGLAGGRVVEVVGVRAFAAVLLAVAAGAAAGLRGATVPGHLAIAAPERTAIVAALVVAALAGSAFALALVPALVHFAVARLLLASLAAERSLIEIGARLSHPLAPDFVRPYCRRLTVVWAFAFAASAGVTTVLAAASPSAHAAWTAWQFWTVLGAFSVVEFFFRKAWFRYYGRGPFDRFLARLLPPERTERGRRSQAWLMRMRAELARMANEERERAAR